MALRKCRKCGSWVLPDARACPSCGIESPIAPDNRDGSHNGSLAAILLLSAIGAIGAFFTARTVVGSDSVAITAWTLTGLLAGWLIGDVVGNLFLRSSTAVFSAPAPDPTATVHAEAPGALEEAIRQLQPEPESSPVDEAIASVVPAIEAEPHTSINELEKVDEEEELPELSSEPAAIDEPEPQETGVELDEAESIIVFHSTDEDEPHSGSLTEPSKDFPPPEKVEDQPTPAIQPQQITVHRIRRRLL
jgi:hypothetical protein